jgi:PST family polysaccharide transporter
MLKKNALIDKIKSKLKNKDAKVILENFIFLSVLQLVNLILPLVTLPYVIKMFGFELYGVIVLAASLILYFQSITDYSFRITATRDVAVFRDSQKKLNLIYSKVMYVKFIFLTISCLIISLIIFLTPSFRENSSVFFLTMPMLLGYTLFPEWFFQGIEKMKYITLLNAGIKVFFTICVFVFIKSKSDYWMYPLFQSSGYIVAAIIGQFILQKKYKLKLVKVKVSSIKDTITKNFPIFVNQFLPSLYNNTSGFILGLVAGTYWIGIYDALRKIIDFSIVIINVVSRVFFPFLNRNKNHFEKYKNIMLSIATLLTIIPVLLHDLIVRYLNINYVNSFSITVILSLGVLFYSFYDIFGLNYFIIKRKDKLVMKNTLIASTIGLLLSYPMVYFFGIFGASLNLTISRAIMGLGLFYNYKKGHD